MISFEKTVGEAENGKEHKEYLKKELSDVLIDAMAACARAKPDNPTLFVADYLREHA